MPPRRHPEFYIGYLGQTPPGLGRFVRRWVVALVVASGLIAVLLTARQSPFAPSVFEFGVERSFEGEVVNLPYPTLVVERPHPGGRGVGTPRGGALEEKSRYYLVATGKRGATQEVAGLAGHRVRLAGSLIYRDGQTVIEVAPGSVRSLGPTEAAGTQPQGETLGRFTFRGEIVDSKCYLGVMKPGRGKPHRACASLCIRGGIPPVLVVGGQAGERHHLLLVDEGGKAVNDRILDRVAETVEVTGELSRLGDLLILAANPAHYRRLESGHGPE